MNLPFIPLVFVLLFPLSGLVEAKEPVTAKETDPTMKALDPYLIDALYGQQRDGKGGRHGKEGGLKELLAEPSFVRLVKEHDLSLFNGPLVGDIRTDAAKIWVRTAGAAQVEVGLDGGRTFSASTSEANDFTTTVHLEGLQAFTEYRYTVTINGKIFDKPGFQFRTAPVRGQKVRFDVNFGSGSRYRPENEHAWSTMARQKPLAYLGLGDNVYIDVVDHRGAQRLFYYRRYLSPSYAELCASTAIYGIWDDHDMAMNDSAGGLGMKYPWKRPNWKVFTENWNNPAYGGGRKVPGTWHSFSLGDVDFFMTDGRFYRDKGARTMLGPDQKAWLLSELKAAQGTFKVIASGTMFADGADKDGKDSWAGTWAREERNEIFDLITREKINGVILISGDRHRCDIWKIDRPGYPLYEFVSAKVTNSHTHRTYENAVWSYNKGNFWGQLTFDFTQQDSAVTFKCVDISGKVVKQFPLRISALSH
ncbi:MAG: alkaline phosphatase [Verrucomicrobiaceae bacterium]|nr:alkaline phosphatase [Verrucomicrobiaceae bacterium]